MKDKRFLAGQPFQQKAVPANTPRGNVSWSGLERQVVQVQKQIALACQNGDRQTVHRLQQQLMESEAARLLAVRRVTEENQGKDTAGVDGVKSLNARERLEMASAIHPKHWSQHPSMPVRRVWIPKSGTGERRPLAILPMIDRCKQALAKLALEPEWEVQFEGHSYGFRPGRGTHDAIAAILVAIERRPCFVFDADIEGAFDNVDQPAVLDKLQTFPALRRAINTWLTAGVLDGNSYTPSQTGIAQGGILSPLLMNVALHGMEAVVTEGSVKGRAGEQPLLIRYADDFVILHSDLKELQQAVRRVKHWLARIGLRLHADKTRFTHTLTPYQGQVGFDFLGFNIRQQPLKKSPVSKSGREQPVRVETLVVPSQEANKRHMTVIEQRLQRLQADSQERVITELNPLILGWANYYNGVVAAPVMSRYDELLEQRLLRWAGKRHPGKAREWLFGRYWQRMGQQRVFATNDGVQLRTYQPTKIL